MKNNVRKQAVARSVNSTSTYRTLYRHSNTRNKLNSKNNWQKLRVINDDISDVDPESDSDHVKECDLDETGEVYLKEQAIHEDYTDIDDELSALKKNKHEAIRSKVQDLDAHEVLESASSEMHQLQQGLCGSTPDVERLLGHLLKMNIQSATSNCQNEQTMTFLKTLYHKSASDDNPIQIQSKIPVPIQPTQQQTSLKQFLQQKLHQSFKSNLSVPSPPTLATKTVRFLDEALDHNACGDLQMFEKSNCQNLNEATLISNSPANFNNNDARKNDIWKKDFSEIHLGKSSLNNSYNTDATSNIGIFNVSTSIQSIQDEADNKCSQQLEDVNPTFSPIPTQRMKQIESPLQNTPSSIANFSNTTSDKPPIPKPRKTFTEHLPTVSQLIYGSPPPPKKSSEEVLENEIDQPLPVPKRRMSTTSPKFQDDKTTFDTVFLNTKLDNLLEARMKVAGMTSADVYDMDKNSIQNCLTSGHRQTNQQCSKTKTVKRPTTTTSSKYKPTLNKKSL